MVRGVLMLRTFSYWSGRESMTIGLLLDDVVNIIGKNHLPPLGSFLQQHPPHFSLLSFRFAGLCIRNKLNLTVICMKGCFLFTGIS